MLHDTVRIEVTDEQVHKPVKHEDDVEVDKNVEALRAQTNFLAHHYWSDDDPCNEYDLGEVIPLHVPVVLGVNDELAYLLWLHVGQVFVQILVDFVALVHLLDSITTHAGHHADDFLFLTHCCPMMLGAIDFLLLFVSGME